MNKIVLSTVAIAMLALTGANADSTSDIADMKAMITQMNQRLATLEKENIQLKSQVKKTKTSTAKKNKTIVASTKVEKDITTLKGVPEITIVREDSPEFLLGKETDINMNFKAQDNPNMWLRAGVRIQGTFENKETDYADDINDGPDTTLQDGYLRRTRFEIAAGFDEYSSFVMDIRNDKANIEDKGEGGFNVGDAYVQIKKPFDSSLVNFKLYRAKIDVSRTETVKSARLLSYDRPYVADEAAQFISENRRAANVQMYGDWNKKIHYQVALGDATASGSAKDATGASLDGSIDDQNFFYGGKIILSPFDGWEETDRTETYFGEGKHFEVGVGYWKANGIEYSTLDSTDHTLVNYELSAHYKNAFVQAEYFDFDGVVQKWGTNVTGKSSGWYATGEYVIPEFFYLAPFVRYEEWDKWNDAEEYDLTSKVAGVNWYLRGNTTKVGLLLQKDTYGKNLKDGARETTSARVTSQWFF